MITAIFKLLCCFASAMDEIEPWPVNEDVRAAKKAGRLAYLLETAAIVLLAALAA